MKTDIIITCHKEFEVPRNEYLKPIIVGASEIGNTSPNFLRDDAGENISSSNRTFGEVTGMYWLWQHSLADYVGLMHYRRYLMINKNINVSIPNGGYYAMYEDMETFKQDNCLTKACIDECINNFDLVIPKWIGGPTNKSQYCDNHTYGHETYGILEDVIKEKYPEYFAILERYSVHRITTLFNMFIARRNIFDRMCSMVFNVLFEVEKRTRAIHGGTCPDRIIGAISERLLGSYFLSLDHEHKYRICAVNVAYIEKIDCK